MSEKLKTNLSMELLKNEGEFWGYASTTNIIDDDGDEIIHGAFKKTLKEWTARGKCPPFCWQHKMDELIGVISEVKEDNKGLRIKGKFLLDLPKAKEAYLLLKENAVDSFSIGFRATKYRYLDNNKRFSRNSDNNISEVGFGKIRQILELSLKEISFVSVPANSASTVYEYKTACGSSQEIQKLLRKISKIKQQLLY
jgi:uncharacterized protein